MDTKTLEKIKKECGGMTDIEDFKTVMGKIIIENEINLTKSLITDLNRILKDKTTPIELGVIALRRDLKKGVKLLKTF